jgi:hypothetical protein
MRTWPVEGDTARPFLLLSKPQSGSITEIALGVWVHKTTQSMGLLHHGARHHSSSSCCRYHGYITKDYCICYMVQFEPEHPFGSQDGSWGTMQCVPRVQTAVITYLREHQAVAGAWHCRPHQVDCKAQAPRWPLLSSQVGASRCSTACRTQHTRAHACSAQGQCRAQHTVMHAAFTSIILLSMHACSAPGQGRDPAHTHASSAPGQCRTQQTHPLAVLAVPTRALECSKHSAGQRRRPAAGLKEVHTCKQDICFQHTLAAVQAQLPRVRQCHDQGRIAALAGILQQLLCQLTHALHAGVGPAIVGLWLEGLQAAHGPQ